MVGKDTGKTIQDILQKPLVPGQVQPSSGLVILDKKYLETIEPVCGEIVFKKKITGMSGEAGSGKSTFLYTLTRECQREHGTFLNFEVKKTRVFHLDYETGEALRKIKQERLNFTEADLKGVTYAITHNLFLTKEELIYRLTTGKYGLLIIDSLPEAFVDNPQRYRSVNAEATAEMNLLREIAERANVGVIFTLNFGGGSQSQINVYKMKGAKERMDKADVIINFYSKPDTDISVFHIVKNRVIGTTFKLAVKKGIEDNLTLADPSELVVTTMTKQKLFEGKILNLLSDGKIRKRNQLIQELGVTESELPTLEKALEALHTFGLIRKPSFGMYVKR
ncbi:MAG: AAA family ATPase [Candidatus Thorarchaeota archaeon]